MKMNNKKKHMINKFLTTLQLAFLLIFISACQPSQQQTDTVQDENKIEPAEMQTLTPEIAAEIIKETADSLTQNLMRVVQTKGPAHAIDFCNVHAVKITLASTLANITVNRKAIQYRNPLNKPDSIATKTMQLMAEWSEKQLKNEYVILNLENETRFYKPIVLMPQCLMCHGNIETDIGPIVAETIDNLYPNDLAKNFLPGQLRGVWELIQPK